ncbi:bifunctional [glutamate--ammonia ligase]-adenylyl-L-tyrosine phosphorylase/[glutamate--ammonia-ligase] adenylyltransferase [Nitrosococcus watsonii]|uniref:Bifunctional glutamine synthetase adenylyltransferase/adenylyl-removing enzyme n=1 Tax=Nitrosococcus watsoni (strain C-113) TaxID=105559 RepID=D8K8A7_NITWC|nr:bifunctional [glutamate--ammonia ligase]-adenylyl-L-tyrosine phosphorylase/[glutamate--ammonia-ligase] adenylyltransferase [Nitrosococcus watsonii]ADJ27102.1 (Glutamate--ammonia-ligase) adenylyltransferase [Nitrosococcus watsonii C-113]
MNWQANIHKLPALLQGRLENDLARFQEALEQKDLEAVLKVKTLETLYLVWGASEFVATTCIRWPSLLLDLQGSGDLFRAYEPNHYAKNLAQQLTDISTETELMIALRRFRQREMVRIIWRDLAGWASLDEVFRELSQLAEACLNRALACLHYWQSEALGTPYGAVSGKPQSMVVLGMGKLGARELNLSSDIDLIFAYPESGETRGAQRTLSNEEYFIRLARRLIRVLDERTEEGFVFRVDMRLRPDGDSGPLVTSFTAMENYYQNQGRDWERYAMIKARVVAGDCQAGTHLIAMLRPFSYRRYLDFGAIESLRGMKAMITQELRRQGIEANIKLGPGGIREIEFIGQSFQLIRGGREPALQERGILRVLALLAERDHLPYYAKEELCTAYIFLRRVEHRLQAYRDEQTHYLPTSAEGRARLAFAMGYGDWGAFASALEEHRRRVQEHFEQLFAAPHMDITDQMAQEKRLAEVWSGGELQEASLAVLSAAGYRAPEEAVQTLMYLRQSYTVRTLSAQARIRLDQLMPLLLGAVGRAEHPEQCLQRVIILLETVAQRTAYLALLAEYPMALSQLVKLCAASPLIARQLTRYPLLLDELLDPRSLYRVLDYASLADDLERSLGTIPEDDLEQQMELLRHFCQRQTLRVAAADVTGVLPLMKVGDHLTYLAEVILKKCLELSWRHLTRRHGRLPSSTGEQPEESGFAVIGYGKLGGYELGYGSDLDLVFLHSAKLGDPPTEGKKPLDPVVFYSRLGQRLIHILQTSTPSGKLYEVDTRLRPSGASGFLVSGLDAYRDYQCGQAWTWEHQALVRARFVAGDARLGAAFTAMRREILGRRRDPVKLREEVRQMRAKMRNQLDRSQRGWFDLKQGRGGIADIEFMVQYGVLAWAHAYPQLLEYPDNIRILEGFAQAGLLASEESLLLADAYRAYRAAANRLSLQTHEARVEEGQFRQERIAVQRLWSALLEE